MLTLANRLTILRVLMTPVIVGLLMYRQMGAALALFLLAGITDALDGLVARSWRQKTALGIVLDPLADKLLLTSTVITLTILKELPRWFAIILVSRDVFLIGGSMILYMFLGKLDAPPSWPPDASPSPSPAAPAAGPAAPRAAAPTAGPR